MPAIAGGRARWRRGRDRDHGRRERVGGRLGAARARGVPRGDADRAGFEPRLRRWCQRRARALAGGARPPREQRRDGRAGRTGGAAARASGRRPRRRLRGRADALRRPAGDDQLGRHRHRPVGDRLRPTARQPGLGQRDRARRGLRRERRGGAVAALGARGGRTLRRIVLRLPRGRRRRVARAHAGVAGAVRARGGGSSPPLRHGGPRLALQIPLGRPQPRTPAGPQRHHLAARPRSGRDARLRPGLRRLRGRPRAYAGAVAGPSARPARVAQRAALRGPRAPRGRTRGAPGPGRGPAASPGLARGRRPPAS